MDPVAAALWAKVQHDWEDDAAHAAFVAHCRMQNDLGTAAARYRAVAADEGAYRSSADRSGDAKKRLAAIATLAVIQLQATATTPEEARRPRRMIAVVAVALACAAAVLLIRVWS